jgi:hypothetical protein
VEDRTEERPARPGETCTCGRQAVVVYLNAEFGDVPSCGEWHLPPLDDRRRPEDIRVERARLALAEYRDTDLGEMTIDAMAGWLGRFAMVVENLLGLIDAPVILPPGDER